MRILLASRFDRQVGGVETYLSRLAPLLRAAGHAVGLVFEYETGEDRETVAGIESDDRFHLSQTTGGKVFPAILAWKPDVVFIHHFDNVDFERKLIACAPAVFFAHDYNRTCISGGKTFHLPRIVPCNRRFGAGCLACFFPRRCGGLNPVSMLRDFRSKAARLDNLKACNTIVTHSQRMRNEFLALGFEESKVRRVGFHVDPPQPSPGDAVKSLDETVHLLFLARMDRLKGASVLIDAVSRIAPRLKREIHLHIAGDGPDAAMIREKGRRIETNTPSVRIEFHGWVGAEARRALFESCHLMVVPSLWPEPFGQVGLEAGFFGMPSAAFEVGGIPDWLREGVNGFLAPANPPDSNGLADAIIRCIADDETYQSLSRGAAEVAREYAGEAHLEAVLKTLKEAATIG